MIKKFIAPLAASLLVFASCQSTKTEDTPTQDTTNVASAEPAETGLNQLTEAQKAEGWKVLFDGQSTSGFRFYKNKENNSWEVVDGTLHAKPNGAGADKRADLVTVDQYENFELMFDWRVPAAGNSGVMFRVTEENDAPYLSGPEYQVIDDKGWPGDPLKQTQLSGSNYDMHAAPADKPLNPQGEWNSSKIVVNGNHVEHWLNGAKMLEYELNSDEWKKLKAGSKWKDAKGYGASPKGLIAFQDHGQEIWFRNIYIKTL
ncbi:MAG TPA: DUF1080 domain-containing protein [Chryseosolibacter sp.]